MLSQRKVVNHHEWGVTGRHAPAAFLAQTSFLTPFGNAAVGIGAKERFVGT